MFLCVKKKNKCVSLFDVVMKYNTNIMNVKYTNEKNLSTINLNKGRFVITKTLRKYLYIQIVLRN